MSEAQKEEKKDAATVEQEAEQVPNADSIDEISAEDMMAAEELVSAAAEAGEPIALEVASVALDESNPTSGDSDPSTGNEHQEADKIDSNEDKDQVVKETQVGPEEAAHKAVEAEEEVPEVSSSTNKPTATVQTNINPHYQQQQQQHYHHHGHSKSMRHRRPSYNSRYGYGGVGTGGGAGGANTQNYGLTYLPYKSNFEPSEDARRRADEFFKSLKL